jgi:hypothetical protein
MKVSRTRGLKFRALIGSGKHAISGLHADHKIYWPIHT